MRIRTTELHQHVGRSIQVAGWLHQLRRLRRLAFLIIRDGRGTAQVVVEDPALITTLDDLCRESILSVEGVVVANPQAPGGVEVRRPAVTVLAAPRVPPPLDLHHPELSAQQSTVLDHAPVALRHPKWRACFRVAAASLTGFRAALQTMDFVEIQTPKIVGAATEGGANVFSIDYFGRPAYLAQSPQFYKQIMVGVFERVFEVGPVFRAEPHDTPRHLNEYVSLDVEMGFIGDHSDVMRVLTRVLARMVTAILEGAGDSLALLGIAPPEIPASIPAIHFRTALEMISEATATDVRGEPDLAPDHERRLGEWARRVHGSDFLFVFGYPTATRPFYTHPDPMRPEFSNSFDLLFRGVELVTGGQRLHRYEDYVAALASRGLSAEPLAGYLEAFKHGMPPHGGFAIGLERWVAALVGVPNVRTVTLFPRDRQRLTP
jgi:nondiscriminating aspartyl-tRNA synthetase